MACAQDAAEEAMDDLGGVHRRLLDSSLQLPVVHTDVVDPHECIRLPGSSLTADLLLRCTEKNINGLFVAMTGRSSGVLPYRDGVCDGGSEQVSH